MQQASGRVAATSQAMGLAVNDDRGLEQEADAAGAQAARGEPVTMPDAGRGEVAPRGVGQAAGNAAQLSPKQSHHGTFTDVQYQLHGDQLAMTLAFTPNDQVNASKIGLVQSLRSTAGGNSFEIDPTTTARTSSTGHFIDRMSESNNPIYGAASLGDGQQLDQTAAVTTGHDRDHFHRDHRGPGDQGPGTRDQGPRTRGPPAEKWPARSYDRMIFEHAPKGMKARVISSSLRP